MKRIRHTLGILAVALAATAAAGCSGGRSAGDWHPRLYGGEVARVKAKPAKARGGKGQKQGGHDTSHRNGKGKKKGHGRH